VYKFKQKKKKRLDIFKQNKSNNYKSNTSAISQANDENMLMDGLTKSPKNIFQKLFKPYENVQPKSITVDMSKPHSIIEEVFSWVKKQQTREEILMRGANSSHISTPKASGRDLPSNNLQQSFFSPMTISRNAVKTG
jgi:hypothetical protein